jgi:hypothetical protein
MLPKNFNSGICMNCSLRIKIKKNSVCYAEDNHLNLNPDLKPLLHIFPFVRVTF